MKFSVQGTRLHRTVLLRMEHIKFHLVLNIRLNTGGLRMSRVLPGVGGTIGAHPWMCRGCALQCGGLLRYFRTAAGAYHRLCQQVAMSMNMPWLHAG